MKFNNMKSLIPVAAFTLMIGFSSCVGDLDVKPINPQQTMTLDQNALFNKICKFLFDRTDRPER